MPTYAIGDVQGCYTEMMRLLDHVCFDPAHDRLWLVGDVVNRGPDSLPVLRYIRSLGDSAVMVLGNHDLHLLAIASSTAARRSKDASLFQVLDAPEAAELLDWLRCQPLLHHDADLGFTMIHAGLPPQWDLVMAQACAREVEQVLRGEEYAAFFAHMYGDEPALWSGQLSGWERLRFITNCLTRLRYCDQQGRLALQPKGAPGTQPESLWPWFDLPDRRSRDMRIVFGHWSTLGCHFDDGVFALDSGCLWGGHLTALRLEDMEAFSVPCQSACRPGES